MIQKSKLATHRGHKVVHGAVPEEQEGEHGGLVALRHEEWRQVLA
jgi:hypothetical protein